MENRLSNKKNPKKPHLQKTLKNHPPPPTPQRQASDLFWKIIMGLVSCEGWNKNLNSACLFLSLWCTVLRCFESYNLCICNLEINFTQKPKTCFMSAVWDQHMKPTEITKSKENAALKSAIWKQQEKNSSDFWDDLLPWMKF